MSIVIASCHSYSFTGANVDAKNIKIDYIDNTAELTSPYLQSSMTQKLREKIQGLTRLDLVNTDSADMELKGTVQKYYVDVAALQNVDVTTVNRLIISLSVEYINRVNPKLSFTKSYERYADFSANQTLQSVENAKIDEIVPMLVDDIFNNTFANW